MKPLIEYSVIVPVYFGEKTLVPLFQRINQFFASNGLSYEIIFVWDNGPDNSWEVIKQLKKNHSGYIKGIKLTRNFGQHNALICGFKYARGAFIITMDEDLQHHPEDIILLIKKQKKDDLDIVYGKYGKLNHKWFRNITSIILKKLLNSAIPELHPDYSAFRLIKSSIAKVCLEMNNSYTFLDGYLAWITQSVGSCEVKHSERQAGESSYTLKKLINHSINIFVTFSNLPIRLLTLISFIIFTFSLTYSIYIFIRAIIYNDFLPGFPTIIVTIGMGIGLILMGIGIIGEYLFRINQKTTKRPIFLEREEI